MTPIFKSTRASWSSQAIGRALRKIGDLSPPNQSNYWSLQTMQRICLWKDGNLPDDIAKRMTVLNGRYDLSPFDSEGLRKQVYVLYSAREQITDLVNEYRAMSLGASAKVIKAKIRKAEELYTEEFETFEMMFKLSTDLSIDGYYYPI